MRLVPATSAGTSPLPRALLKPDQYRHCARRWPTRALSSESGGEPPSRDVWRAASLSDRLFVYDKQLALTHRAEHMAIALPDPGPPNAEFERPADRSHLERTAAALATRGFKAQIADSAEHARQRVLEAIPEGAEVHSALSETLRELGITNEIDTSGRYESIRSQLNELDRQTQGRERRKLGAAPDYIVGSAHAITDAGEIIIGSGTGRQ